MGAQRRESDPPLSEPKLGVGDRVILSLEAESNVPPFCIIPPKREVEILEVRTLPLIGATYITKFATDCGGMHEVIFHLRVLEKCCKVKV